jgi:ribosome biogenesis GTPase
LLLHSYGWTPYWSDLFRQFAADDPTLLPGRVTRVERGRCELITASGVQFASWRITPPALGDWVVLDPVSGRVRTALPPNNRLVRSAPEDRGSLQTLAANFHTVGVVMGLDADYNLSRLGRYLELIEASRAQPLVILNKRDLCADPYGRLAQSERAAPGARIEVLSAKEDDLSGWLASILPAGETLILVGSSGAGKSTLTNALLGGDVQSTREVRAHDGRGRHCTTRRQLYLTPCGRVLGDLPGIRMVGVPESEPGVKPLYDPHDPRQAEERKRKERILARACRAFQRGTKKW